MLSEMEALAMQPLRSSVQRRRLRSELEHGNPVRVVAEIESGLLDEPDLANADRAALLLLYADALDASGRDMEADGIRADIVEQYPESEAGRLRARRLGTRAATPRS